ncbi:MAG: YifB family Mg chelatase-like AAA ATPase [bacterium]
MLVKVNTGNILGVDANPVVVEVDVASGGMPGCNLVGLPSTSVNEGKVRVKAAIANAGFKLESRRITINLAPAEMRKDTAAFDLPIALGILGAFELLPKASLRGIFAVGELALDGRLRAIRGTVPIADLARRLAAQELIVPRDSAREAAVVTGLKVRAAHHLQEVVSHLRGETLLPLSYPLSTAEQETIPDVDLADVKGQQVPKRALEIAAAGGHNLLFVGPPGAGKSMLARRLPTILPQLELEEALAVTKIFSVAGLLPSAGLIRSRPFRAPHHTVSQVGLVGGGPNLRPGELTLAHHGVLFLDELLEFQRGTLEALRQPLEDRFITITRARGTVTFPANVQLVSAMNPCPCGHHGDPRRSCVCSQAAIERYWSRLSGPLLDRIDLHVEVGALTFAEMTRAADEEYSRDVRTRVQRARRVQLARPSTRRCNARLTAEQVRRTCGLDEQTRRLVETAVDRLGLSARAVGRLVKVSRTIADLAGEEAIQAHHMAEALAYRQLTCA